MPAKKVNNRVKRSHVAAISLVLQGSEKNSRFLLAQGKAQMTDVEKRAVAILAQSTQAEYNEIMARWAGNRYYGPDIWPPFLALQEALSEAQDEGEVVEALDEFRQLAESLVLSAGDGDGDEPAYMNQPVAQSHTSTPQGRLMKVTDQAGNVYDVSPMVLAQSQPAVIPAGTGLPPGAALPPTTVSTIAPAPAPQNQLQAAPVATTPAAQLPDMTQPVSLGTPSTVRPEDEANPDSPEAIARQVKPFTPPAGAPPPAALSDAFHQQVAAARQGDDPYASAFAGIQPAPAPVAAPAGYQVPGSAFVDADGNTWQMTQPAASNPAVPVTPQAPVSGAPDQIVAQAAAVIQQQKAEIERLRATQSRQPQFYDLNPAPRQVDGSPAGLVAQGKGDMWGSLFDPITAK